MPFTSETAKLARAKVTQPPFDRRAWIREWMRRERQRRIRHGICQRCGMVAVEVYRTCVECRLAGAAWRARKGREQA